MKKGSLNFLGRKKTSLFDSKIQVNQDIDNVELVLDSSAIPESGTAKVRSRPTVKHFAPSSEVVQGFAVPTPKVPDLPPFGGPKINGAVNGDRLSNGSALSVPDLVEGEIFIPPPPSMAPPPPPSFIPPPPNFLGNLDSADLASLQPPSMPPPKPPSLAPSEEEEDLSFLKPPPMAPPKPPSTSSNASTSSLPISTPPSPFIPDMTECPKFTPPPPLQRTHKNPPLKPTRLSSIPSLDVPPQTPALTPPVQTSTPSSFNPQNTAKLYSIPKTSILGDKVNREKRPKQILLLEDSETADSVAGPVQVNDNTPSVVPPAKPARRNSCGNHLEKGLQDLKDNLHATLPTPQTQLQTNTEIKTETTIAAQQEVDKPAQEGSLKLPRESPVPSVAPVANQVRLDKSPSQAHNYSPLLDRKLRQLKGSEATAAKEGPAASPLALLMAAKQRDKHKSSLSRENSAKGSEPKPTASIQPSESNPNTFTVVPRSTSFSSATSLDRPPQRPQSVDISTPTLGMQTPEPARAAEKLPVNPVLLTSRSSSSSSLNVEKQSAERRPSPSDGVHDEENGEEQCMPLLPPPPEFANFDDEVVGSPPSVPAPAPPLMNSLPPTTTAPVTPVKAHLPPPPPPAKPKPPSPPKLPLPTTSAVKPKPSVQIKATPPPTQPPASSLTSSQATLLSILQKKMLEMDQKMTVPIKETEAISDEWGSPLSEEDTKIPVAPRVTPVPTFSQKPKSSTLPVQTKVLDMHELETKVAKKAQDASSKVSTSTGPHSKQPHGMTFIVRPGTTQPITLVGKGDSS
ncbi:uncharacterized protein C6orf132 [Osmerus mordax]|uniref:uncharacterized protein C6orf132 n=1 Tax=Osmerus mordax TaxID=8014 RepID=UPI00350F9DBA